MGNIIGSCGHDITDSWERAGLWYWGYEGRERCLSYGSVCSACRPHYDVATMAEVTARRAVAQPWEVSDAE